MKRREFIKAGAGAFAIAAAGSAGVEFWGRKYEKGWELA